MNPAMPSDRQKPQKLIKGEISNIKKEQLGVGKSKIVCTNQQMNGLALTILASMGR